PGPGHSATHGAHQVAHTLIMRNLSVWFFVSAFTPSASIVSSVTGAFSHALASCWTSFFPIHFVEQPIGRVTSTGTALPATIASTALRRSGDFTVAGSA